MEAHERRDTTPTEHTAPTEEDAATAPPGDDGSGDLEAARRAGEDLLAAGDDAIRRALSEDSEAFLRSVRQTGGQ